MATEAKKERVHVTMPLQTKQCVDRLQARIGASTRSATIRRALALLAVNYAWALVDRDRQYLQDRIAGTRLFVLPPER